MTRVASLLCAAAAALAWGADGGFEPAETNGRGTPARWALRGGEVVVADNPNTGDTFSLFLSARAVPADARAGARVRAIAGAEDPGGGICLRVADPGTYYVCRWNPREQNLRLYVVVAGRRRVLASKVVKVGAGEEHDVEIAARGDRLECRFDGETLIEVRDATIRGGGRFGAWVKADARTAFAALGAR